MKKVVGSIMLAISFLLVTNLSVAQCGDKKHTSSASIDCHSATAKIAAVEFHADKCQMSKHLDAKLAELKGKFKDNVVFVKLDFSNDDAAAKAKSYAAEQGLNAVLEAQKKTGYLVLYDLKSKKIVATLDSEQSLADMEKEIKNYL